MTAIHTGIDRSLGRLVDVTGRWEQTARGRAALRRLTALIHTAARGVRHVHRHRRYLTVRRVANLALIELQFKLKTERVIGRPKSMKIEPTNICNTSCQLCPTGQKLEGRPKGKMDFDAYRKLIDTHAWHLMALDLSMWGDPLIVPDIYKMIRYAHDRRIWTYISSNLHAFKIGPTRQQREAGEPEQAVQLVESGLGMLTCSLHGASQATFEHYQPGKDFAAAVEKVKHIIATRDRLGSATPEVQLNFVVTRHNEHEKDAFRALAADLGAKAVFSRPAMNIRFLDKDKQLQPLGLAPDLVAKKTKQRLDDWLPEDESFVLEPYREIAETGEFHGEKYNGKKLFDCSWPWKQAVVNWDGTVATCCGSFDQREDMGSVFEGGFAKVWNGEKYRLARRSFKSKLTDEQKQDNPCAECPGFML